MGSICCKDDEDIEVRRIQKKAYPRQVPSIIQEEESQMQSSYSPYPKKMTDNTTQQFEESQQLTLSHHPYPPQNLHNSFKSIISNQKVLKIINQMTAQSLKSSMAKNPLVKNTYKSELVLSDINDYLEWNFIFTEGRHLSNSSLSDLPNQKVRIQHCLTKNFLCAIPDPYQKTHIVCTSNQIGDESIWEVQLQNNNEIQFHFGDQFQLIHCSSQGRLTFMRKKNIIQTVYILRLTSKVDDKRAIWVAEKID